MKNNNSLRSKIYAAISRPPCERCKQSTPATEEQCAQFDCKTLYNQETDAVLKIIRTEILDYPDMHEEIKSHADCYQSLRRYMPPEKVKESIADHYPPRTVTDHDLYHTAHCLVSERHSKYALIEMVYSLLLEIDRRAEND